jgi:hypothetical protein
MDSVSSPKQRNTQFSVVRPKDGRAETERGLLEDDFGFNPAFYFHENDFLDYSLRPISFGDSQDVELTVSMPQEDPNKQQVPQAFPKAKSLPLDDLVAD